MLSANQPGIPTLLGSTLLFLLATGCGDESVASATAATTGDDSETTGDDTENTTGDDSETTGDDTENTTGDDSESTTGDGQSWPDPADAPHYDGKAFTAMQIYAVESGLWLDETALLEGLDPARLIFVGERHQTPAIHELQRWVLERELLRHGEVTLAMEHFQADEQAVIDAYLAGEIDAATFESTSDPWDGYAIYWKQLVDTMRLAERPVLGVNVPREALDSIYASFPSPPLEVFNGWGANFPYDAFLPPRPLDAWDATYQEYFEGSFDYDAHGKGWGLSYTEALDYFTALALIRDDTMGFHIARHLEETSARIVAVAGDWHVHAGLATPDSASKFSDLASDSRVITTATHAAFPSVRETTYAERPIADYILVYDPL